MERDSERDARELGAATTVAVRNKSALQPEHQALLDTLLADPGMARETREALLEHLLEEEGPQLTRALVQLRGGRGAAAITKGPARERGLTVGSLQRKESGARAGRGTVGPLDR